jgi:hypothetical protein
MPYRLPLQGLQTSSNGTVVLSQPEAKGAFELVVGEERALGLDAAKHLRPGTYSMTDDVDDFERHPEIPTLYRTCFSPSAPVPYVQFRYTQRYAKYGESLY